MIRRAFLSAISVLPLAGLKRTKSTGSREIEIVDNKFVNLEELMSESEWRHSSPLCSNRECMATYLNMDVKVTEIAWQDETRIYLYSYKKHQTCEGWNFVMDLSHFLKGMK